MVLAGGFRTFRNNLWLTMGNPHYVIQAKNGDFVEWYWLPYEVDNLALESLALGWRFLLRRS